VPAALKAILLYGR